MWTMDAYRRRVRCCACAGSLRRSKHVNLVSLQRRATWQYPVWRNVLTGEDGEAVAVVCDACLDANREIQEAVEFRGAEVLYHTVIDLERLPPPQNWMLVRSGWRLGIHCLVCGAAKAGFAEGCTACGSAFEGGDLEAAWAAAQSPRPAAAGPDRR